VIPDSGFIHTEQQSIGDAPPATAAALMRGDELGHPPELPAGVTISDAAPAATGRSSYVLVCLVLLALVVMAIAIWA
jgi:hypothetical protein